MPLPRFRIRTLMIAVAVVGVMMVPLMEHPELAVLPIALLGLSVLPALVASTVFRHCQRKRGWLNHRDWVGIFGLSFVFLLPVDLGIAAVIFAAILD